MDLRNMIRFGGRFRVRVLTVSEDEDDPDEIAGDGGVGGEADGGQILARA